MTTALGAARADVREEPSGRVPAHLRDAHYPGAAKLGHGDGYRYPHDDPSGWVDQEYRPAEVAGRRYYEPSGHGADVGPAPEADAGNDQGRESARGGPGRRTEGDGS